MKQYLESLNHVLSTGEKRVDRTGVGTKAVFGLQTRYDLQAGFPMVTTKKVWWSGVVGELIWFISGNTNIKPLLQNKIKFWTAWALQRYNKENPDEQLDQDEFERLVIENDDFAFKWGDLGPVYGKQWRDFSGVDQLMQVIEQIKTNPTSRRHIVSAWNPAEVPDMLLPPCHMMYQFYVSNDGRLSCHLYQRSGDMFLGVPFNIASYSLLTHMVAQQCDLEVGEFVHTIGDAHIYTNHTLQVIEQLSRKPHPLPLLKLNKKGSILDYTAKDCKLVGYKAHKAIKGDIAV